MIPGRPPDGSPDSPAPDARPGLEGLAAQAQGDDPQKRLAAVRRLERDWGPAAAGVLVQCLADDHPPVAEAAAQALLHLRGREVASRLINLLSAEQVGLRNRALSLLRQVGEDAPDLILGLLAEADGDLRIFAAELLATVQASGVTKALLQAMGDPDPNLRQTVATSLGRRGEVAAIGALLAALDDDQWVAYAAVEALAAIGDPVVCEPLLKALPGKDSLTQTAIAQAVGQLSDPRAVPAIMEALRGARGGVATALVGALLRAGEPGLFAQVDPVLRERLGEGLTEALDDPSDAIKISALRGLALLAQPSHAQAVLAMLGRGCSSAAYQQAVAALTAMGPAPALLEALSQPQPLAAQAAAKVLGQLRGEDARQALLSALKHEQVMVRSQAAASLGEIGGEGALQALRDLLSDPEPQARAEAARALGALGLPQAVPDLARLLAAADPALRQEARDALLALGGERVRAVFRQALASPEPELRRLAARALGGMEVGPQELDLLAGMLDDPQAEVRAAAARVLAACPAYDDWEALEGLLADPEPGVRLALLAELAGRDHPASRRLLRQALADGDPRVVQRAVKALARLGAKETLEPLLALLAGGDSALKIAVAEAMGAMGAWEASSRVFELLGDPDPQVRGAASAALLEMEEGRG